MIFSVPACEQKPEPINYGSDECDHCRMRIMDDQYGAEIVTDKGKAYKFDSIECLISFSLDKNFTGDKNQLMLVTNFANPGELIDAAKAFYVHNDKFRSPMGLNVAGFQTELQKKDFIKNNSGNELNWIELIELVKHNNM